MPDEAELEVVHLSPERPQLGQVGFPGAPPGTIIPTSSTPSVLREFVTVTLMSSILAATKQLFTTTPEVGLPASSRTPKWIADQYQQQSVWRRKVVGTARDTLLLMGSNVMYAGLQSLAGAVRRSDDPVNEAFAASLTAGFLAGTLFQPFRMSKVVTAAVVGGMLGAYSFKERQLLMARLLAEQQALEKEILKIPEEEVSQRLDRAKLREMLLLVQQQLRDKRQQARHVPFAGEDGSSSGSSSSGSGQKGSVATPEHVQIAESVESWQQLLGSAPWLTAGGDQPGPGGGGEARQGQEEGQQQQQVDPRQRAQQWRRQLQQRRPAQQGAEGGSPEEGQPESARY